jgi:hypothetical protein
MSDTLGKKWPPFGLFELFSPLPHVECVARLVAITRDASSPLEGSVRERYFRVCWRYQPVGLSRVRNSFQPYLFGRFRGLDGGTIIRCHFTLHPIVIWALAITGCVGIAGVAIAHDWRFTSVPLMGLILASAGSAVSWVEREFIMYRLGAAINARRL